MLPTEPQSTMKVFFGGIKAFKEIFLSVLPISAVFFIINLSVSIPNKFFLSKSNQWLYICLYFFIFPVLSIFCSYWGSCFVYGKLTRQNISYKTALKTAINRFLKTLLTYIIPIIALTALTVTAFFSLKLINHYLLIEKSIFLFSSIAIFIITLPTIACFFVVSKIEVLLKDASIFSAIKTAIKISFKIGSTWKVLCFISIMLFFAIIGIALFSFLPIKYLKLNIIFINFFVLSITSIYLPLCSTLFIYLYNDLILRYEGRRLDN